MGQVTQETIVVTAVEDDQSICDGTLMRRRVAGGGHTEASDCTQIPELCLDQSYVRFDQRCSQD
jgi:hypothetical protein